KPHQAIYRRLSVSRHCFFHRSNIMFQRTIPFSPLLEQLEPKKVLIFLKKLLAAESAQSKPLAAHVSVFARMFTYLRASFHVTAHVYVSVRIFSLHRACFCVCAHLPISTRMFTCLRASSRVITYTHFNAGLISASLKIREHYF